MEGLEKKLEDLATTLEGKAKNEVKTAIEAFMTENTKAITEATTEVKDALLKEIETLKENAEKMQEHADALDVKLQKKTKGENAEPRFVDNMKTLITENLEVISEVSKSNSIKLETKAVGNMTLANLTGDQPRDYSFDVAMVPGQMVAFSDLIGTVNISNGTYTYPRETGSEGAIATQTEGADKGQIDYDLTMVDASTDFIAGFAVYSKKMRNNLPFLESFVPRALRRDYLIAESGVFNTALAAAATASTQIITGKNKAEMILNELATLEASNFSANVIVMRPADWYDILKSTRPTTGTDYSLPGLVTLEGGVLRFNGVQVVKANWLAANKYYVGDWSTLDKVVTEGLSVEFSENDEDNFRKNNITARIEAQVALAIYRPDAIIYGDFTAV